MDEQSDQDEKLSLLNTQPTLGSWKCSSRGCCTETERFLRITGTELIRSAAVLLKLPQVASSTAQVLFQRFFFCASFAEFSVLKIALASLFLSTKLEECPRRNRDLVNVFHYLCERHKGRAPKLLDFNSHRYNLLRDDMFSGEMCILDKLGFNVHVQHPHGFMVNYVQSLDLARNHALVQHAWNFLNDCGHTLAMVLFQPPVIAAASIALAARETGVVLPTSPPWWDVFDATWDEIDMVMGLVCSLYNEKLPPSLPIDVAIKAGTNGCLHHSRRLGSLQPCQQIARHHARIQLDKPSRDKLDSPVAHGLDRRL
ncbi:cyclin-like protein [Entophlyctis helioformis]|nr:cyclin-like protein [Entophlyctis helioformis]